ncbi:hypothetical protein PILCRDRAFT_329307 [Piloderma croceum F 1598]|uniref:Uncharacterized protein n=1 Tax=Piloderma croceum (strain F 1598) TaxID=765440 RepID=A0A0C3G224_PILCF|nr:hypothetical protein PILCRDRAFT_329307 [Piloderma croceum F 1598]
MKFFAVATAFMVVLATSAAGTAVGPASKPQKSCTTPPECPCTLGHTKFCRNEAVNPKCLKGHIFECDEAKGKACDMGISDSCRK